MEEEDNTTRQADEIEALAAIYGAEWCVVDEGHRVFCIAITDGSVKPEYTVCLQVTFPPEYPSLSPPHYQINGPWLNGDDRMELSNQLEQIYCENVGDSLVYIWVEYIREFVVGYSDRQNCDKPNASAYHRAVTLSNETEHDFEDDDFDPNAVFITTHVVESPSAQEDCECPTVDHGGVLTDRRSVFQPHLARVLHKKQVDLVMQTLLENRKIANATHNMLAYRIEHGSSFIQGCDDDGETHAGSRMLHLLQIVDARNVMVVVSRWFGGILLGPDRFKHISNCTRQILEEHGFIKEKDDKKKIKGKKERKK